MGDVEEHSEHSQRLSQGLCSSLSKLSFHYPVSLLYITSVSSLPSIVPPVVVIDLSCTFHIHLLEFVSILFLVLKGSASFGLVHLTVVLLLKSVLILCLTRFLQLSLIILGTIHIHFYIKCPVHLACFLFLCFIFFHYFINLYLSVLFLHFISFLIFKIFSI